MELKGLVATHMGTLASPPGRGSFEKKHARHAEKRSLPEEDQSFLGVHLSSVFLTPWLVV